MHICMLVSEEGKYQIPWSWNSVSSKQLNMGFQESNSGPLEQQ